MFLSPSPAARPRAKAPPATGPLELCQSLALHWGRLHAGAVSCRTPACLVRHLGFYLAHVGCGLAQRELARRAGCHPSTVAYGVRRIEGLRDDARLDRQFARLEDLARALAFEAQP